MKRYENNILLRIELAREICARSRDGYSSIQNSLNQNCYTITLNCVIPYLNEGINIKMTTYNWEFDLDHRDLSVLSIITTKPLTPDIKMTKRTQFPLPLSLRGCKSARGGEGSLRGKSEKIKMLNIAKRTHFPAILNQFEGWPTPRPRSGLNYAKLIRSSSGAIQNSDKLFRRHKPAKLLVKFSGRFGRHNLFQCFSLFYQV